ncbi:hypothetical protein JGD85_24775 [Salmonella enterica subsp. enterica serovar Typhimurium]|nr:hypothetical protein [Salmonella enterica subsp. enterica serovar Typhimurium]
MTLTSRTNTVATKDDEPVKTGLTASPGGRTAIHTKTGLTAAKAGQTASPGLRKILSVENRNLLEFSNQ